MVVTCVLPVAFLFFPPVETAPPLVGACGGGMGGAAGFDCFWVCFVCFVPSFVTLPWSGFVTPTLSFALTDRRLRRLCLGGVGVCAGDEGDIDSPSSDGELSLPLDGVRIRRDMSVDARE